MIAMEIVVNWLKKEKLTLFDVGAHTGLYTDLILSKFKQFERIVCFEPQKECYRILREKYDGNRVVRCENVALGDRPGDQTLRYDTLNSSIAKISDLRGERFCERVEVKTLDSYLRENGIEQIDFLKIDTEGFEYKILKGASESINRGRIAVIQFEFGETFLGTGATLKDIFDLTGSRYSIFRILRKGIVPAEYAYDWEIYKITNFICVLNSLRR